MWYSIDGSRIQTFFSLSPFAADPPPSRRTLPQRPANWLQPFPQGQERQKPWRYAPHFRPANGQASCGAEDHFRGYGRRLFPPPSLPPPLQITNRQCFLLHNSGKAYIMEKTISKEGTCYVSAGLDGQHPGISGNDPEILRQGNQRQRLQGLFGLFRQLRPAGRECQYAPSADGRRAADQGTPGVPHQPHPHR